MQVMIFSSVYLVIHFGAAHRPVGFAGVANSQERYRVSHPECPVERCGAPNTCDGSSGDALQAASSGSGPFGVAGGGGSKVVNLAQGVL